MTENRERDEPWCFGTRAPGGRERDHRASTRPRRRPMLPAMLCGVLAGSIVAAGVLLASPAAHAAAGDPLPDLSPAHLARFADGLAALEREYTPETGLGPTFNAESCVACHNEPAAGGGSTITVTRFGRRDGDDYDQLLHLGGPLLQSEAIDDACAEVVPAEANVIVERLSTPFFGGGLIESIPDEKIVEMADPDDEDGDGISGRVRFVSYPGVVRVGRFGWKAHEATLLSFNAEAMAVEMGITSELVPGTPPPNGDTALAAVCEAIEGVDEPEDRTQPGVTAAELVKMTNFSRLLAPPTVGERPAGRGWRLFRRARCQSCHVARAQTERHTIPALAWKTFYPYSDFLLHDMGSLGDGIVDGGAGATEMRTSPLWGIGARTLFLHDGRATTLEEAVAMHDGEAAWSRDRFFRLREDGQRRLLEFVAGL